jgi:hypothetical protein
VADIGGLLEGGRERYGLLDVDWLGWFDGGGDQRAHERVLLSNVAMVCPAYLSEGVSAISVCPLAEPLLDWEVLT